MEMYVSVCDPEETDHQCTNKNHFFFFFEVGEIFINFVVVLVLKCFTGLKK